MKHGMGGMALMLLLWAGSAEAQVANGDFSGTAIAWDWFQKTSKKSFDTCDKDPDYSVIAPARGQTPSMGYAPASGRVALITPDVGYGNGSYLLCGRIEQVVHVPNGSRLRFVARIGDELPQRATAFTVHDGYLSVRVVEAGTNQIIKLINVRGASKDCPITRPQCTEFASYSVDVSKYWGKTVKIVFQGTTKYTYDSWGLSGRPSPIYLDNVVLN
jgi:hypothetical protein